MPLTDANNLSLEEKQAEMPQKDRKIANKQKKKRSIALHHINNTKAGRQTFDGLVVWPRNDVGKKKKNGGQKCSK
jgi:hypothetical protein